MIYEWIELLKLGIFLLGCKMVFLGDGLVDGDMKL